MAEPKNSAEDRLRVDRWLWCARFFKTRSVAAEAVRCGHVRLNGERIKAAHPVKVGDTLRIDIGESEERDISVAAIPLRRGPAAEAAGSYVETPESIERRRQHAEQRTLNPVPAPPTWGKPDKRTRRLLLRARQRGAISFQ